MAESKFLMKFCKGKRHTGVGVNAQKSTTRHGYAFEHHCPLPFPPIRTMWAHFPSVTEGFIALLWSLTNHVTFLDGVPDIFGFDVSSTDDVIEQIKNLSTKFLFRTTSRSSSLHLLRRAAILGKSPRSLIGQCDPTWTSRARRLVCGMIAAIWLTNFPLGAHQLL